MKETKEKTRDPEKCPHQRVNRVGEQWRCNECRTEFVPKNPRHRTEWPKES